MSVADLVETTIISPIEGTVTVQETAVTQPTPTAFDFIGQQMLITVPSVQPDNAPYTFVFTIDPSLLVPPLVSATADHTDPLDNDRIKIFKNGIEARNVPERRHQSSDDPCVNRACGR